MLLTRRDFLWWAAGAATFALTPKTKSEPKVEVIGVDKGVDDCSTAYYFNQTGQMELDAVMRDVNPSGVIRHRPDGSVFIQPLTCTHSIKEFKYGDS